MDSMERQIREFLLRNRKMNGGRDVGAPLSEDFYRFLMDELEGEALQKMTSHLLTHPEDQELVVEARRLLETQAESEAEKVPRRLIQKAKGLMKPGSGLKCPHCGRGITPFKRPLAKQTLWNAAWLCLAAACFLTSFILHRYFIQFSIFGFLFAVKWIVDQKATKTQILIYRALKEDSEEARGRLHKISSGL